MCSALRPFLLALAAVGLSAPSLADTLTNVDEVIAAHIEARGGLEALRAIKNTRAEGTMTMGPMQMPFTAELARPNKMRVEFNFQGMTAVQAFDGEKGWQIMPMMGKTDPEPMGPDETKQAKEQADLEGSLVDYKAKGNSVELLGVEEVDGTEAYKLKVVKADGGEETHYIDAEYFLTIKTDAKVKMQGQELQGSATFGDYQDVAGTQVPFSVTNTIIGPMGEMKQEMVITKVEVNLDMPADRFTQPAASAAN